MLRCMDIIRYSDCFYNYKSVIYLTARHFRITVIREPLAGRFEWLRSCMAKTDLPGAAGVFF